MLLLSFKAGLRAKEIARRPGDGVGFRRRVGDTLEVGK